MNPAPDSPPQLRRALTLPKLTLYGLGTTIGAGIYALIGEVAKVAGYGAPLTFLIACIVASFTACSFAELSARYPRAAGAALYVQQGFGREWLALAVGLLVVCAGVVSSAALVNGFAGHFQAFFGVERLWMVLIVTLVLGGVAAWGIAESATLAVVITLIETGGLLVLIAVGAEGFADLAERWPEFLPGSGTVSWGPVLFGVTLAFYAFIGFEDIVDVAEEVKDVHRNMPRAILLTLAIATLLYLLLALSALLAMRPDELAASGAPLAALFEHHTGQSGLVIGFVAMLAIINGSLIQLVMVSRVLYGLSSRGQLPALLCRVHPRTRTPVIATALATTLVLALALLGRLAGLANATSLIMLCIFAMVNLALWHLKGRKATPRAGVEFPRAFPLVGFGLSVGLVGWELSDLLR